MVRMHECLNRWGFIKGTGAVPTMNAEKPTLKIHIFSKLRTLNFELKTRNKLQAAVRSSQRGPNIELNKHEI